MADTSVPEGTFKRHGPTLLLWMGLEATETTFKETVFGLVDEIFTLVEKAILLGEEFNSIS